MKVLELFSGTGSVSKVCDELGYEVISVDISNKFSQPTFLCSILDFDYRQYEVGHFDIIWASPPCATFSHFQICWIGRGKKREIIENNARCSFISCGDARGLSFNHQLKRLYQRRCLIIDR
jgi:hypothetical protein